MTFQQVQYTLVHKLVLHSGWKFEQRLKLHARVSTAMRIEISEHLHCAMAFCTANADVSKTLEVSLIVDVVFGYSKFEWFPWIDECGGSN